MTIENEWQIVRMSDIAIGIYDGPHATPKKTAAGPIFLGISSLHHGRLDLKETEHLSENDFIRWTRRVKPQSNDIVFSYETRIGEVALIPDGLRCCLGRRMALVRPNVTKINPRFLLYQFVSPQFQEFLKSRTISGSTVDRILLTEFPNFPVVLPPIDEQLAIAGILGALDDKIELNQQMNRTLESMAQAIFKSWFVDFDPVVAKGAGHQPYGMDAERAALFPDAFVISDVGSIPVGWKTRKLPELIDFLEGPGLRNWQYRPEGLKFLNIRCLSDGDIDLSNANCITQEEFERKYRHFALQLNDIVISTSGTLGRLSIVRQEHLPVMLNTSIIRMRGIHPVGQGFVYCLLKSDQFLQEMFAAATGSVQLNFGPVHLKQISVLYPGDGLMREFELLTNCCLERITGNRRQNDLLVKLRDTLLHKLLSGEIRVREAEKEAKKVL